MQRFPNSRGVPLTTWPCYPGGLFDTLNNLATLDAAGESAFIIGAVHLEGGAAGGTKTISAAGSGKLYTRFGAVTFANGSTNLRMGLQDVDASTGIEDATFDVYADLVGGTDTITANTVRETTMTSGSKTLTHGDVIAIGCELTGRGGADSLVMQAVNHTTAAPSLFPYRTVDSGSGPAKGTGTLPMFTIVFDDGTRGWIDPFFCVNGNTGTAFAANSTPDERALVFELPFKAVLEGVDIFVGAIASGDDFEVVFYTDPTGTPVAAQTITVDPDLIGANSSGWVRVKFTEVTLEADTLYAIAVRPTTNNAIQIYQVDFAFAALKGPTPLGDNWSLGTRSNQSGAFSLATDDELPTMSLYLNQLSDDAGGGGGTARRGNMLGAWRV